jgi:CRP/FNR family transcriptional regulator, polysaccharide utilization system transcription regulator
MFEKQMPLYDCDSCLFKEISCRFLSRDEFEVIRRMSTQLYFEKGETILKQGAKATHTVFLHKGIVKFNYHNESGKNFIMTIVNGPRILGGANLFFKETNLFSLEAVENSELCLIDNRAFGQALLKHGSYLMALFRESIEMFQVPIFNFISLAHKQVNGRIADIIIYLSEHVYMSHEFQLTLTRKEIAEFAACSPENVITTLSRLNREGVITLDGKHFKINDYKKLREISKIG